MQAKDPHILNEEQRPKQKSANIVFHKLVNDWPWQLSQFHLFS